MSKKENPLLAKLAAQRPADMADVPPILAKMNAAPQAAVATVDVPAAKPRPASAGRPKAAAVATAGVRMGVSLNGPASAALRRLRAAILDAGGSSASTSGVIAAALAFAAEALPASSAHLVELYAEQAQTDKRRKQSE